MKRYKRVFILLGVLVILVAAAFGVSHMRQRREAIRTFGETFLAIPSDTVTALDWTNGDTSLAFRKDGTWHWTEDEAFPVDQQKLSKLLAPFEDMAAAFVIDDVTDYGQYGLDDPACTIHLTAGETVTTVKLGAYSSLDQQRYVDIGDGRVYLAADDPMDAYDVELAGLIEHDAIPALDPAAFTASGEVELSARYTEDGDSYCDEDRYFTPDGLPMDTDLVRAWLDRLEGLTLTDYVTYNATAEELASWGLDSPSLTLAFTQKDGETVTISLSELVPPEDSGEETTAYIRVGDSPLVYALSPDDYALLARCGYDDLRHRELVTAPFDTVTGLTVTLEGESRAFEKGENSDGETVWTLDGQETPMTSLEAAIEALSAHEFTDQEPSGKLEIALTLNFDSEAHPTLTLELYRLDGSLCTAKVNGQTVATVSRSTVVTLIEAVNALVLG